MNIAIVDRAPARVACLRYTGPVGESLGRFWRVTVTPWLAERDLMDCPRYGVCVDDPTNTPPDGCRYDAPPEQFRSLLDRTVGPAPVAAGR